MVDDCSADDLVARFHARSQVYATHGYDRFDAARSIASVLDPPKSGAVLDVGTGKGVFAVALAARGATVVSVDANPAERPLAEALARDAGVNGRLTLLTGDAAALPYPTGHFAAAAAVEVLHHLQSPEPVLREMARTLMPHGELLLADFTPDGLDLVARVHRDEGRTHPVSGVTMDQAVALLECWGFCTVARLTRHLHDVAVLTRHHHALGQDTLHDTCRALHPHCMVCGRDNPAGLRLVFAVQPDQSVHATFGGGATYQGTPDAVHGGLLATLLEAAMTHCLFSRGVSASLARMTIVHERPARWYEPCEVSGRLDRTVRGVRHLAARVTQDGRLVASATGVFVAQLPGTQDAGASAPAGTGA